MRFRTHSKRFTLGLVAFVLAFSLITPGIAWATPPQNGPEAVSVTNDGTLGNRDSQVDGLSTNGRYVAFRSRSTNLPGGQDEGFYIRDRQTGTTELATVNSAGEPANRGSLRPVLSGDGRHLIFSSNATNLDPASPSEQAFGIFMRDLNTGITQLVSYVGGAPMVSPQTQLSGVSDDGTVVAFNGSTFSQLYVRDLTTDQTQQVPLEQIFGSSAGTIGIPIVSGNGRFVTFSYHLNNVGQTVARYDRLDNSLITLPSHLLTGNPSPQDISFDGRYIIITDGAANHGVYRYDTQTGIVITLASSGEIRLTSDGQTALILTGPEQVYTFDFTTSHMLMVSFNATGEPVKPRVVAYPYISDEGTFAFTSPATNLGPFVTYTVFGQTFVRNQAYVGSTAITPGLPEVNNLTLDPATIDLGGSSTLTATATVAFSLIERVEYFVGTDPGEGNGSLLALNSNVWSATLGSDLAPGEHTVYVRAQNKSGEWSPLQSTQLTVISPDATAPVLGTPSWSANPKAINESTSLTIPATDDLSGVATGEYFIGDTDPGVGNGATLAWDGTNLSTQFGTDFQPGVYKISVRAKDNAGNWSAATTDFLVVFDPNGPGITGRRSVTPSLAAGDVLPGLNDPNQNDRATFAFTVEYNAQGVIANNSDLMFDYQTGTLCVIPFLANNCHRTTLNSNNISWLVTDGANQSEGIFVGQASLTVDGTSTSNPYKVTALDGDRLNVQTDDHFMLHIFEPGGNPLTDTPIYTVSQNVQSGNIKIQ